MTGDESVIMTQRIVLLAALALASVASAAGYYLPGTYPQEFVVGQQLQGKSAMHARIAGCMVHFAAVTVVQIPKLA